MSEVLRVEWYMYDFNFLCNNQTKKLPDLLLLKLIGKVESTPIERESNKRRRAACVILYSWFYYVVWVDDYVCYSVSLGCY